jgi:hypothetical protein
VSKHIDGPRKVASSTHNKLSTRLQRTQSVVLEQVRGSEYRDKFKGKGAPSAEVETADLETTLGIRTTLQTLQYRSPGGSVVP